MKNHIINMCYKIQRKIKNSKWIIVILVKIYTWIKYFVGYVISLLRLEAGDAKNVIKFYNTFPHLIN